MVVSVGGFVETRNKGQSQRVIVRTGGIHKIYFSKASRNKDGEAFACFRCDRLGKIFRTKRWVIKNSANPERATIEAKCPDCKSRCFKLLKEPRPGVGGAGNNM